MSTKLTSTILTIDAGNTRVKWGLFDASEANVVMQSSGVCPNTALASLVLPAASRVIISNVAGDLIAAQLAQLLAGYSQVSWLKTQASACGVLNRYQQPQSLGTDRWAALIAAWHIQQAPCVVVNAGTAVTIDALSVNAQNNQAEFIGGLILPGLNLMQHSLGQATAQLPATKLAITKLTARAQQHSQDIFPKNTAEAIYTGALQAICGAITLSANALHVECKQIPSIVISGGNAALIQGHLMACVTNHVLIVDNLVLHGLYLIGNFMQSESQ